LADFQYDIMIVLKWLFGATLYTVSCECNNKDMLSTAQRISPHNTVCLVQWM